MTWEHFFCTELIKKMGLYSDKGKQQAFIRTVTKRRTLLKICLDWNTQGGRWADSGCRLIEAMGWDKRLLSGREGVKMSWRQVSVHSLWISGRVHLLQQVSYERKHPSPQDNSHCSGRDPSKQWPAPNRDDRPQARRQSRSVGALVFKVGWDAVRIRESYGSSCFRFPHAASHTVTETSVGPTPAV